jgi:hypothetical protein
MGVPSPPPPPLPPFLLSKVPLLHPSYFWLVLVYLAVLFGVAVFAFVLVLRLALSEWGSLSRKEKIVDVSFFICFALLLLIVFVGFVTLLAKGVYPTWK